MPVSSAMRFLRSRCTAMTVGPESVVRFPMEVVAYSPQCMTILRPRPLMFAQALQVHVVLRTMFSSAVANDV